MDELMNELTDGTLKFTTTPHNFMKYADFMHSIGSIKNDPKSWKDVFFPNIYHLPGS
jgi:NitT/TauT family transport system substrate-binding protein